jgi:hypothetical protein
MASMNMRSTAKDLYHVGVAIVMVLLILGLATWSGILTCRDIPGWCDVYYGIKGPPKTLIVFGAEGLGDPDLLATALRNPDYAAATNISRQELDYISAGNLKQYDLVIVTRARQMSTDQLKSFMEFVDGGGRLVWTGDAGTQLTKGDQFLYLDDVDENEAHTLISPWARKDVEADEQVRFDQYLSVEYQGNWCAIRDQQAGGCEISQQVGTLVPESGADHRLIYGMKSGLRLHGDFALVDDIGIGSTRVLSVDTQTIVRDLNNTELGRVFPIIVTSGIGEKVVYYAIPPELFTLEPMKYWLFIENLYNGMLR